MGGLHIEMAFLSAIGDWLQGSGWVLLIVKANITTEGRAECVLKGSRTSRSKWAHQVMSCALHILLHPAQCIPREPW